MTETLSWMRPRAHTTHLPAPAVQMPSLGAGQRAIARILASLAVAALAVIASAPAAAQSVALTGIMGSRALLVIDGAAPQVVALGEVRLGVTLISTSGDTAVVEMHGQRQTLRVGESPVSVGAHGGPPEGKQVVLHAGSGGHFFGTAQLNGVTTPFVVDTGASNVVIGAAQAEQMGLNFRSGQREMVVTANGYVTSYRVPLNSVRIGDVEVFNVDATVVQAGLPAVLLGNSFLARFQMKQENDQLVLEKRY
jgi:aspartyl protease family protein